MRVALDAMAGPAPPEAIVASTLPTLRANKDLRVTFVGDLDQIQPALIDLGKARDRVFTHPASQVIASDEDPAEALRLKPDTSIGRCWQLLAEKKVDGLVTLGPVPAIVAAGMQLRRLLRHVRRPGLAAFLPTSKGRCLVIDAGAHTQIRPAHLYQFSVMGALYCRYLHRTDRPRIGLLRTDAHELVHEADRLLEAGPATQRYVGLVDPDNVFQAEIDVLVCDGTTGELLLNTCGTVVDLLNQTPRPGPKLTGPRPLLGFEGVCLTATTIDALDETLTLALRLEELALNTKIEQALELGPLIGLSEPEA